MYCKPVHRLATVMVLSVVTAFCLPAGADPVIYDNGIPDEVGGILSGVFGGQIALDDFVLEEGANVITDVHWWGAFTDVPESLDDLSFALAIFDDLGNLQTPIISPLVSPTVQPTDLDIQFPAAPLDIYEFSVYLSEPLALDPGETYYLALAYFGESGWFWATSNQTGTHTIFQTANGMTPIAGLGDLAFQLTGGVIPEPATMSLLGLGLGGLALRRMRTARR